MNILKLNKSVYGLLFFLLVWVVNALAQETISADDLEKIYQNNDVSIIFAGSEEDYRMHIPNAVLIPHRLLSDQEPVSNKIKNPDEVAKILSENGISADNTLIIYDEGSGKSASRMYWILKYVGAPDVMVLDGNWKAWKAGGNHVTVTTPKKKEKKFKTDANASQLATLEEVKKAIDDSSYIIVDARTLEEFAGTNETDLRRGHIPSAANVDYETIRDENGMLKSVSELKSIFESKGITPNKTVISYCSSGVRACSVYLALKELSYPNVKVYDGSFLEWEQNIHNPIERK